MPDLLADYDRLGLPPDAALRRVIARAAADPQLASDLEFLFFRVEPMLAERLDCEAPNFFVMAQDGAGNAWGVYVDPDLAPTRGAPWVMWDHEEDALNYVADDTAGFFARLLDFCAHHRPDDPRIERVHAALVECGLQLGAPGSGPPDLLVARPVDWLPRGPLSS